MSDFATEQIPLFPLSAPLVPDGRLPLRIFEPRYTDMVRQCMREQSVFGVVLLRQGSEVHQEGQAPQFASVGTTARIIDFNQLPDGLLGIMAAGEQRFTVTGSHVQADQLLLGDVRMLPPDPPLAVNETLQPLVTVLAQLMEHPLVKKMNLLTDLSDAHAVAWRLIELLPLPPPEKQEFLELRDPQERLARLGMRLAERFGGG